MADRDASRIVIAFPDLDYDGDGATDLTSAFDACVFSGPAWSGFDRPSTETTCSSNTLDSWGNLIRTFRGGSVIDYGSITLGVDWDPDESTVGGKIFAVSKIRDAFTIDIELPAEGAETTGPKIQFSVVCTNYTPQGEILGTEDEARFAAELTFKLCGAPTFVAAT